MPTHVQTLGVCQIEQEQNLWCWAACAEMVLRYYDICHVRQCDFANWLFKQTHCCTEPSSAECNRGCFVHDVSSLYLQWNIRSTFIGGMVPFSVLQAEIDAGRPVEIGFLWKEQGIAHVVLISGWHTDGTEEFVHVNDPNNGFQFLTYAELQTAYGKGTWSFTWTGIRR